MRPVISKRPRRPCFSDRAILPGGGPGERPRYEGDPRTLIPSVRKRKASSGSGIAPRRPLSHQPSLGGAETCYATGSRTTAARGASENKRKTGGNFAGARARLARGAREPNRRIQTLSPKVRGVGKPLLYPLSYGLGRRVATDLIASRPALKLVTCRSRTVDPSSP